MLSPSKTHSYSLFCQHNSNSPHTSGNFSGTKPSCSPHPSLLQPDKLFHSPMYLVFIEPTSFLILHLLRGLGGAYLLPSVDRKIPVGRTVSAFAYCCIHSTVHITVSQYCVWYKTVLVQDALTEYQRDWVGYKAQTFISDSLEHGKCKVNVLADLVSGESPLLGL